MLRLVLSCLFLTLSISCATTQSGQTAKSSKDECVDKPAMTGSRIRQTTCPSKS